MDEAVTAEIVTALSCTPCPSRGNYCPPTAGTTERFVNPVFRLPDFVPASAHAGPPARKLPRLGGEWASC